MAELVTTQIANRLRARREELNVTQSEIARALKTSQTSVQKILQGEARKSEFVKPMWKFLGLPESELMALLGGSHDKDVVVHPKAGAGQDLMVVEPKANHAEPVEVKEVVSVERLTRLFGVHFGRTREGELVMRVYHADGTSRTYVVDSNLQAVIARHTTAQPSSTQQ